MANDSMRTGPRGASDQAAWHGPYRTPLMQAAGVIDPLGGPGILALALAATGRWQGSAAIGAGLPVGEARGSMVLDIGGGTTEIAVFSMGGIVISRSLRVAGDEMDEDIIEYARSKHHLAIGERMAERVKISVGSAYSLAEEKMVTLRGRNLVTGLPEAVEVSSIEIRDALGESVRTLINLVKEAIDETPPEIIADLMETGVCLAGGVAQLQGLAQRLGEEIKVDCWVADDPLTCVARGAGYILDDLDNLARFLVGLERGSTRHH